MKQRTVYGTEDAILVLTALIEQMDDLRDRDGNLHPDNAKALPPGAGALSRPRQRSRLERTR